MSSEQGVTLLVIAGLAVRAWGNIVSKLTLERHLHSHLIGSLSRAAALVLVVGKRHRPDYWTSH
jgi:uncharacterized YccA/Bax inhibitor family protein